MNELSFGECDESVVEKSDSARDNECGIQTRRVICVAHVSDDFAEAAIRADEHFADDDQNQRERNSCPHPKKYLWGCFWQVEQNHALQSGQTERSRHAQAGRTAPVQASQCRQADNERGTESSDGNFGRVANSVDYQKYRDERGCRNRAQEIEKELRRLPCAAPKENQEACNQSNRQADGEGQGASANR